MGSEVAMGRGQAGEALPCGSGIREQGGLQLRLPVTPLVQVPP